MRNPSTQNQSKNNRSADFGDVFRRRDHRLAKSESDKKEARAFRRNFRHVNPAQMTEWDD